MNNNLSILLESLLDEGKLDDFYSKQKEKYPNLIKQIQFLLDKQIPIKYFDWILKQINVVSPEPIQDIVPLVQSFEKNQGKLQKKNISQYKNTTELQYALEDLNKTKELQQQSNKIVSNEQQDVLTEKDGWFVTFPHTTAASCDLGKGTTWCTVRTESGNMFLNYVGRNQNIILFYVINPNLNPRKDPKAKLSVGFIDGESKFDMGDNQLTVKADNSNLGYDEFGQIVGYDNAMLFLDAMQKKVDELEGTHPAQKELMALATNYDLFLKKVASYKNTPQNYEAKKDLFELLEDFMNEENDTIITIKSIRDYIDKFNQDIDYKEAIASGYYPKLLTPEKLEELSNDIEPKVRQNVAKNKLTPPDTLLKLSNDPDLHIKRIIANNINTPIEALINLSTLNDSSIKFNLVENPNLPSNILKQYAHDPAGHIRQHVAKNPNTSIETLLELSHDKSFIVLEALLKNPNITPEILDNISKLSNPILREMIADNHKTSSETLDFIAKKETMSGSVLNAIIYSKNVSLETLKHIIDFSKNDKVTKEAALWAYNKKLNLQNTNNPIMESTKQRNINNFLAVLNYKNRNNIK